MQLIDRYVYAVTEHLPEEIREDVGRELRSNIEDMLPDDASDSDIRKALMELGNPGKLAEEYNTRKRYLIGPGLYSNYIMVLKLVTGICAAVFAGISLIEWMVNYSGSSVNPGIISLITALISALISAVFEGFIQGALWVTLVFVILERSGVQDGYLPFTGRQWSPDDLPDYPLNKKNRISRAEAVISILWTIIFTALIYFKPQLIAIYIKEGNGSLNAIPLFNMETLQAYLVYILILALVQLGIFVWKLIAGRWSVPLAIANAVYNGAFCILFIAILSNYALYNPVIMSGLKELNNAALTAGISEWWNIGVYVSAAVVVIICILDSISGFLKARKK